VLKVTGVAATAPVAQAITKAGGEVTL
jgi:hypothetical protein